MSENGEIYTAGKKFSLPPALTAWTNSTCAATVLYRNKKIPMGEAELLFHEILLRDPLVASFFILVLLKGGPVKKSPSILSTPETREWSQQLRADIDTLVWIAMI